MDYLKPFVEIARNHAAATLAGIAIKKAQDTCRCASYPFPHRKDGGKCDQSRQESDDFISGLEDQYGNLTVSRREFDRIMKHLYKGL